MQEIKELRDAEFTLDKMDNELVCMTLLRALPDEYSSFASSLQMLDKLEKAKIQEAFVAEELLRNRSNNNRDAPSGALSASALATSTPTTITCKFCSLPGHSQSTCHRYRTAKVTAAQDAKDRAQERRKNRTRGGKGSANTTSEQDSAAAASAVQEFAGKASLRSNSPFNPSQHAADTLWTADTGATSHMTPHKHWLRDYKPFSIPIRLANNHIVHSAGVGTLLFAPELKGGKLGRQVLLSRVLHVPELSSNLLSVLYLVRNHQFQVHISAEHMEFERDGTVYMNDCTH